MKDTKKGSKRTLLSKNSDAFPKLGRVPRYQSSRKRECIAKHLEEEEEEEEHFEWYIAKNK